MTREISLDAIAALAREAKARAAARQIAAAVISPLLHVDTTPSDHTTALADAVLALVERVREMESAGPVMPETPSDAVINASCSYAESLGVRALYRSLRAELAKEQGLTATPSD